jgi:hypothetical protein
MLLIVILSYAYSKFMGSDMPPAFLVSVNALQLYNCLTLVAQIAEIGSEYHAYD